METLNAEKITRVMSSVRKLMYKRLALNLENVYFINQD
jgi:hypothetical protein